MADTVTSQTLENGNRRLVMKFTNYSDGTGETGVTKVNAASANGVVIAGQTYYPGTNLKIVGITYDIHGGGLRIQWHATSNVDIVVLGGFGQRQFLDRRGGFQGLVNTLATGATGSIDFTTVEFGAPFAGGSGPPAYSGGYSGYTVILEMIKGLPQS